MSSRKIAIVGAGISGLTAAARLIELAKNANVNVDVTVFERGGVAGGTITTRYDDGFIIELGADGFLAEKAVVRQLAERLGIAHRLVSTQRCDQPTNVVWRGRLHPIPEGFSMMAPTKFWPVVQSPLLSWRGKARMALELLLPADPPQDDESLGAFVRRRFGAEVLDRFAQPTIAGLYGGDPDRLSLRATMPRFLDEEALSGSVTRGLRARAKAQSQLQSTQVTDTQIKQRTNGVGASEPRVEEGQFVSFDRGMQTLVDALVAALPHGTIRFNSSVDAIESIGDTVVLTAQGDRILFDAIIVATPAPSAANLVATTLPLLSERLREIPHHSMATVALAFDERLFDRPLMGHGFVVPAIEERPSTAGTFLSKKWPNRAPQGKELIQIFLGGSHGPDVARATDAQLINTALGEARALLGVKGDPLFAHVARYVDAMPTLEVGHLRRAEAIDVLCNRQNRFELAGNSVHGVGIADACKTGLRAAERIFATVSLRHRTPALCSELDSW